MSRIGLSLAAKTSQSLSIGVARMLLNPLFSVKSDDSDT